MVLTVNSGLAQVFLQTQCCWCLIAMADGNKTTVWTAIKPFVNGGASGMLATCVIQPIDMVKVRLQLGAQGSPVGLC